MASREESIQTHVSKEEYLIIQEKAKSLGLSVSNYLRLIALHLKIADIKYINLENDVQRGKFIQARVSVAEYIIIEKKAEILKVNISNYLRFIALHARIVISI